MSLAIQICASLVFMVRLYRESSLEADIEADGTRKPGRSDTDSILLLAGRDASVYSYCGVKPSD